MWSYHEVDCSYCLKIMEKLSGLEKIILEKGGFEREVNPQCVAAFSFWAITDSGCGSKSLRIQWKGLGRGPLLKGRETSRG